MCVAAPGVARTLTNRQSYPTPPGGGGVSVWVRARTSPSACVVSYERWCRAYSYLTNGPMGVCAFFERVSGWPGRDRGVRAPYRVVPYGIHSTRVHTRGEGSGIVWCVRGTRVVTYGTRPLSVSLSVCVRLSRVLTIEWTVVEVATLSPGFGCVVCVRPLCTPSVVCMCLVCGKYNRVFAYLT